MRAQSQAHPEVIGATTAKAQLVRLAVAVVATLILLLVWHPRVLKAQAVSPQDTASTTHEVQAGESLWSIATRYYGDGHSWRALARRNGIPTAGDAAIHVGMQLVVPSKNTVAAAAAAAAKLSATTDDVTPSVATTPAAAPDSATAVRMLAAQANSAKANAPKAANAKTPSVASAPSTSLSSQTTGKADARASAIAKTRKATVGKPVVAGVMSGNPVQDSAAMARPSGLRPQIKAERLLTREPSRLGFVENAAFRESRKTSEVRTVFMGHALDADEATAAARLATMPAPPAPRHGEYQAAPYPYSDAAWERTGTIVRRIDAAGPSLHTMARLQLADEIEITLPAGMSPAVGDRYIAVNDDGIYTAASRIASPTGVVQITGVDAGRPIRAYVRSQTGVIKFGQRLFPMEGVAGRADVKPTTLTTPDVETTVSWVETGTLLPSLQSHLMLRAGSTEGVSAGDEFELLGESTTPGASELSRIAIVRVVRVGSLGSSVVVVRQSQPGIAVGGMARRIAKMP